jgi:hypothetical protein
MRAKWLTMMSAAVVVLGGSSATGQGKGSVGRVPRAEVLDLRRLVDGVAEGVSGGGDARIAWDGHFMRAGDGRVYVPFTVTLDDVTEGFGSVTMYVRVLPRGARLGGGRGAGLGLDTAESPTGGISGGTVDGASFRLGLTATETSKVKPSVEGFFIAQMQPIRAQRLVRRSLTVAPGNYDLYVAIRERPGSGGRSTPRAVVLKRELSVPELGGSEPTMSSVIVADRIAVLPAPVPASQQAERPYAFAAAEIFPAADTVFAQSDVLSVVFFVYNLAVDRGNLPDVTIRYRLSRASTLPEIFGELPPQRLARGHSPPVFDAKAGRQLAVTQGLPLASFPPDNYELEIIVLDNLSGRSYQRAVRFSVG